MAIGARNRDSGSHGILIAIAAVVILILAAAAMVIIAYVVFSSGGDEQPIVQTKPTAQSTIKATTTTKATTRATTRATTLKTTTVPVTENTILDIKTTTTVVETTGDVLDKTTTTVKTTTTKRTTTTTEAESDDENNKDEEINEMVLCLLRGGVFLYTSSDTDCGKCQDIEYEIGPWLENGTYDFYFCNEEIDQPYCEADNINVYPTWQYNGQRYPEYTLEDIRDVVGC
jgi:hypothetical protein